MVTIVDYGMANLRSVQKAFEHVGADARIVGSPNDVERADHLVLPGVGAFGDAMANLRRTGFDDAVRKHIDAGRPFLGICLGLQLLFEVGTEHGETPGLGVLRGRCEPFALPEALRLKVPHMGWNTLDSVTDWPLLRDVVGVASTYFVHGYRVVPGDVSVIATTTDYGGAFVSSVWKDNVHATQYHPEKSQAVGLAILKNFTRL